jgi:hypothetical protein
LSDDLEWASGAVKEGTCVICAATKWASGLAYTSPGGKGAEGGRHHFSHYHKPLQLNQLNPEEAAADSFTASTAGCVPQNLENLKEVTVLLQPLRW